MTRKQKHAKCWTNNYNKNDIETTIKMRKGRIGDDNDIYVITYYY